MCSLEILPAVVVKTNDRAESTTVQKCTYTKEFMALLSKQCLDIEEGESPSWSEYVDKQERNLRKYNPILMGKYKGNRTAWEYNECLGLSQKGRTNYRMTIVGSHYGYSPTSRREMKKKKEMKEKEN